MAHWSKEWIAPPLLKNTADIDNGTISLEHRPDDFLSACALFEINYYVSKTLKSSEIGPTKAKATQLAVCTILKALEPSVPQGFWEYTWSVKSYDFGLLMEFLRFGVDPNLGITRTVWSASLEIMYLPMLRLRRDDLNERDEDRAAIMTAFLKAGADRDQATRIIIGVIHNTSSEFVANVDVQLCHALLDNDNVGYGVEESGAANPGPISIEHENKTLRVRFQTDAGEFFSRETISSPHCDLWSDEGHLMSAAQVRVVNEKIRTMFYNLEGHPSARDKDLTVWLLSTFADPCPQCQYFLSPDIKWFTDSDSNDLHM